MSCLVPAPALEGCSVVTIEGLEADVDESVMPPAVNALQRAFVMAGATQCGYCTPGLLMSAARLLAENPAPNRSAIEQGLAGNLCRCTGYAKIIEAVLMASHQALPQATPAQK